MSKEYLDYTTVEGMTVLLDGKGNFLPPGDEPVYLSFKAGEVMQNSRGEAFNFPPLSSCQK